MTSTSARLSKLNKQFDLVTSGKQPLTPKNSPLFLEALCSIVDPVECIARLMGSKEGMKCLPVAMRHDFSKEFLNGKATEVLQYLAHPEVCHIGGGKVLQDILYPIVDPPFFWDAFQGAFKAGELGEASQLCFAWLLLQLVMLPAHQVDPYRLAAQDPDIIERLLSSSVLDIRTTAEMIKHITAVKAVGLPSVIGQGPGGRHDNDFVHFSHIAILPTADELACKEEAFIRPSAVLADPSNKEDRIAIHLDNQFRLLREDMLYEMKEELARNAKRKNRVPTYKDLTLYGIHYSTTDERRNQDKMCKWGIALQFSQDLAILKGVASPKRKEVLKQNGKKILKHQSLVCLLVDGEIISFPTINRDEDLLSKDPPVVVLQLNGEKSSIKTLQKLKTGKTIDMVPTDTAVFAYEPVLKALQEKQDLPLSNELLFWDSDSLLNTVSHRPTHIVNALQWNPRQDLRHILGTKSSIVLDQAQAASLLSGINQRVSLIQGPPGMFGTGKSFIGALLAKALHDTTEETILVVCYTNHALDQFLEDLLKIGIPEASMIRLGKATDATQSLSMHKQPRIPFKRDWQEIDGLKASASLLTSQLEREFREYEASNSQYSDIMEHLEFEHPEFFETFKVPVSTDGMIMVGKKGADADDAYLLNRWMEGLDAGPLQDAPNIQAASEIWQLSSQSRHMHINQWKEEVLKDQVERLYVIGDKYNQCQDSLDRKFREGDEALLMSKRIIGCTTTAAAKYRDIIQAAQPGVLLVEEAGEILEAHILTALGRNSKQVILIGDHKQLRPKVSDYRLTVEKGDGYDLNRSLFERLVLSGYPHTTLVAQHRMRPEISDLVRQLTYPDLQDAPKTQGRPDILGLGSNVVFINHAKPEDNDSRIAEGKDMSAKTSKRNTFEVKMILKIVRYLTQQGYGTNDVVILTPYLGQLRALQEALREDNDPVLNDMDSHDLLRAGLPPIPVGPFGKKKQIRLATIDNYQGEESDIVVASLTRSNSNRDIGFMSSHERLTVLISRARNGFIMIGNSDTFISARKGGEMWKKFFESVKQKGYLFDGLPTFCQRHPDRAAVLRNPEDFDEICPDGGCSQPCGMELKCGLHFCPLKCHRLTDHSNMPCETQMSKKCPIGHLIKWKCSSGPPKLCNKCEKERKEAEKRQKEELERMERLEEEILLHAKYVADLDYQIEQQSKALLDSQAATDRQQERDTKAQELHALRLARASLSPQQSLVSPTNVVSPQQSPPQPSSSTSTNQGPGNLPSKAPRPMSMLNSAARNKWQMQKTAGADNVYIDAIMDMTGLEAVKDQVLAIKDKVDISKQQKANLKGERFNVSMLGNPGTGKTTIARHYGNFLASVHIIPGNMFVETSGSLLAHGGITEAKRQLDSIKAAGGGILFVDEAYQLTGSGNSHNSQGSQVLDFLLAEMENNVGQVVFIFAGYNKEMEKFFEHNPGLPSRVPYTLQFKDYSDEELMEILDNMIVGKFYGQMKVESGDSIPGIRGLYGRIAVRRLGRGRGASGFGNARALANMFAKIWERQAARVSRSTLDGSPVDIFLTTKEDIIGREPAEVMVDSQAWKKLQTMIGLADIKKEVTNLFHMAKMNYDRELLEKNPHQIVLNRVLLGSPGTGKTTVAKYYGQILADLGLISNGEVVVKNPADFIGAYIGHSEKQTKAILASTVGKVLVIDEAYMLYGGSKGGNTDTFKTAVIDTIVAEVQSTPGEDRCVLLLGYKHQMEEMFQNVNPGLSRRFAIENAFHFHDYTDSELREALDWKLKDQDLTATDAAKDVAMEALGRARNRPNFGNIGEVENMLSLAKTRYQARQSSLPIDQRSPDDPFEPQDFDPDYKRNENATTNLTKLFEDVIGCENVIDKLRMWQEMVKNMKARNKDPRGQVPTNFVFKGPPGTGKTTTARKMGKVYYDMGLLSSTEVVECSASDLVGQYVGHTGPKTKQLFEKALGRVLFIDEAYRLSEGRFAKEAMDEIVGILTQDAFRGKLIVILAGYDGEMNELMSVNPGLSSRFPEEIKFENIPPQNCLDILKLKLKKESIFVDALEDKASTEYATMIELVEQLSRLPSWGNARDIETLAKQIITIVYTRTDSLVQDVSSAAMTLKGSEAVKCLEQMLRQSRERLSNMPLRSRPTRAPSPLPCANSPSQGPPPAQAAASSSQPPPAAPPQGSNKPEKNNRNRKQAAKKNPQLPPVPLSNMASHAVQNPAQGIVQPGELLQAQATGIVRDDGVTDAVWQQLENDKRAEKRREEQAQKKTRSLEKLLKDAKEKEDADKKRLTQLYQDYKRAKAEEKEAIKRAQEEAEQRRRAAEAARKKREAELAVENKRMQEEQRKQEKLRSMGVCPQGFQWIKQHSGYRCAGGSHFVSDFALR